MISYSNIIQNPKYRNKYFLVFFFYWLVIFILYLPAARSGMEGDFPYWVQNTKNYNFFDYVNTVSASVHSLYQVTQVVIYLFYKAFGLNVWLWHLLHVTLHAFIGVLLFIMCSKIFSDSGIKNSSVISFTGAFLFCVAPHASEVVVREPCFHYLQGFIFILLIFGCLLRFIDTQKVKYAWFGGIIYLLSTFSLEIFYLTPWLVLILMAYYRIVLRCEKAIFRKSVLLFFVPELLLFFSHLALLRILWGNRLAHIGALSFHNPVGLLNKPILYFFHILLLGRYFPQDLKQKIYTFFDSGRAVFSIYGIVYLLIILILIRFRKMPVKSKAIIMFAAMSISFVILAIPLDFAPLLYVIGDRYIYIPSAFTSIIFALVVSFISYRPLAIMVFSAYLLLNVYITFKINKYWHYSASITKSLLTNLPAKTNKTILLLNLPSNFKGVLMIRAQSPSEFKLMNNLFIKNNKVSNDVYDVCAYNMIHPGDGAHVLVCNDSMLHVTLNQWGSWWWYGDLGAYSYENDMYKLNMIDEGHWYELTLKHPASQFQVFYQVGSQWKEVDWSRKNVDQE